MTKCLLPARSGASSNSLSRRDALGMTGGMLTLGLTGSAHARPAAAATTPRWCRAWYVAMQAPDSYAFFPDIGKLFRDQTLRQRFRTSLGGDAVRIWISNEYGSRPLLVGAAGIARAGVKQAIAAGSHHPLTFSGSGRVEIPPGCVVVSDPAPLPVQALEELSVSLYVPGSTMGDGVSLHQYARATGYASPPGNYCGETAFEPADTFETRVYLCGMDVLRNDDPKLIVAIGDSLTDGEPTPVDANQRYPDFLAARYAQERKAVGVVNLGINGGRLLRPLPGPSLLARLDRDALALQGVHAIVTLIGVNDLGIPEFLQRPDEVESVESMCMGLEQVARRAQARGVLAVGGTLTPTGGASASLPGYDGADFEAKRQKINEWLRTSKVFDRLADFDAALRDPAQPSRLLPEHDCGDHLHFTVRGAQMAADTVWKALAL